MSIGRVGENPVAFPLITNTIVTYCSMVFLGYAFCLSCCWINAEYEMTGIPVMCWGALNIIKILLCPVFVMVLTLRKLHLDLCLLPNSCTCFLLWRITTFCSSVHAESLLSAFSVSSFSFQSVSWDGWFDNKHRSEVSSLVILSTVVPAFCRACWSHHWTWALQESNQNLRRRLRNCTTRLLQVAFQKHKAACSWRSKASQRDPFWTISEARLVLSVWNATKLQGFDTKFQEGPRCDISFEEFLARVEAIAHPGKSSLSRKHRLSSLPLDSDAKRPSNAPGPSPVFLWQRWQLAVVFAFAGALLVLLNLQIVAGYTVEFALQDRCYRLSPNSSSNN